MIAAGGLLAPPIIAAGKSKRVSSRVFLLFILICCILRVRSAFGLLILLPTGVLFLMLSRQASALLQHFISQFIVVHMLVDTFTRTVSYLFSSNAMVAGQIRHSDTAIIAQ
ncbi:MAG: hypothetical protein ACJAQ6_002539 [Arenicella sp.]